MREQSALLQVGDLSEDGVQQNGERRLAVVRDPSGESNIEAGEGGVREGLGAYGWAGGLPDYSLNALKLWRDRKHEDLLQGRVEQEPRVSLVTALRRNPQFSVPLAFAALLLIVGGPVAQWLYASSDGDGATGPLWLGDPVWVWYGRLVGPLLMAIVTTLAALGSVVRRAGRREARWRLSRPSRDG